MQATTLDLTADTIDVRDIIARIEELDSVLETPIEDDIWSDEDRKDAASELRTLTGLMSDLKDMGGDEQWRGNWYPVTLINNMYFKTYAQELAEEIGAVDIDAGWPNNCIDWDMAARELKHDYSAVDIDGTTYWTR